MPGLSSRLSEHLFGNKLLRRLHIEEFTTKGRPRIMVHFPSRKPDTPHIVNLTLASVFFAAQAIRFLLVSLSFELVNLQSQRLSLLPNGQRHEDEGDQCPKCNNGVTDG